MVASTMKNLFVGAILAGALIPIALQYIATANTTGLDSNVVTLWTIVSIAIVIAVVLVFFNQIR